MDGLRLAIALSISGATVNAPVNIELVAASSMRSPYQASILALGRREKTGVVPLGTTLAGLGDKATSKAAKKKGGEKVAKEKSQEGREEKDRQREESQEVTRWRSARRAQVA
jgi:hypothetical protein